MSFSVEGDYFETCTCDISCPCIWLQPANKETCDVILAWHVTKGAKDGVDLSDLNAVLAVHSPKQMTDGGWKLALYLDDRATPSNRRRWVPSSQAVPEAIWPLSGRSSARLPVWSLPPSRSTEKRFAACHGRRCPHHVGRGDQRRRRHLRLHLELSVQRGHAAAHAGTGRRRELPRPVGRGVLGHEQLRYRLQVRGLTRTRPPRRHPVCR